MSVEAALVTYEARRDRFSSRSERNRFYRGLHGYKRTVRRNNEVYHYEKPGLVGETPHIKVADSTFIVPRQHLEKFRQYFREWRGKIDADIYLVTLDERDTIDHGR